MNAGPAPLNVPRRHARCRLCKRPLPPNHAGDLCDAPLCRTRQRVETDLHHSATLRAQRAADRQMRLVRARGLLDTLAQRLGAADRDGVPTTVTPMIEAPLAPPPAEEIARFAAHLDALLDAAFGNGEDQAENAESADPGETDETEARVGAPALPPADLAEREGAAGDEPLALTAACIACGGNCCTWGRYRLAFLTEEDIGHQRFAAPDRSRAQLRDAYMARIPARGVRSSCLFHGEKGCTLPRDLRSLTCNQWQCRPRKELAEKIAAQGPDRSAVVGLAEDHAAHPQAGAPVIRVVTVANFDTLTFHDDLTLPPLLARLGTPDSEK